MGPLRLAVVLSFFSSCGYTASQYVDRWRAYDAAGDPENALLELRKGIARAPKNEPRATTLSHVIAIRTIAKIIDLRGDDSGRYDAEIQRDFEEGYNAADSDELRAEITQTYALHFLHTQRPGRGIPLLLKAMAVLEKSGDEYARYSGYYQLSLAYDMRGDWALSEEAWNKALPLADSYFASSSPSQERRAGYWSDLYGRMYLRLDRRNLDLATKKREIGELFDRLQTLAKDAKLSLAMTYTVGTEIYIQLGDAEKAAQYYATAKTHVPKEFGQYEQMYNDCNFGSYVALTGNAKEGAAMSDRCIAARTRLKIGIQTGTWRWNGETHELAGDWDAAEEAYKKTIASSERSRASLTVAERAGLFTSILRLGYWGLLRTSVKRARATGKNEDAFKALLAADQMRARQFGDAVAEGGGTRLGALKSLADLQARLGPTDLLLNYTLADTELVLIATTRTQIALFSTPVDVSALNARTVRIAEMLATPSSNLKELEILLADMGATALGPAQALLAGKTRLIILPDGPLNTIPFDALSVNAGAYRPLVEDATIVMTPSLAYFAAESDRPAPKGGLFAVANPTYAAPEFTPLPETEREVDAIQKLFQKDAKLLLKADQATLGGIMQAKLGDYAFVHIATHGVLAHELPELDEPALVLAGKDGYLRASDAMALHLNAELTVLSACNTGSGKQIAGEGVMGMSRAFLIAGSRSVVVSLWSVDSAATEKLMVTFYDGFKNGMRADEALRKARLSLRHGEGKTSAARGLVLKSSANSAPEKTAYQHPFYWAAFGLVGR